MGIGHSDNLKLKRLSLGIMRSSSSLKVEMTVLRKCRSIVRLDPRQKLFLQDAFYGRRTLAPAANACRVIAKERWEAEVSGSGGNMKAWQVKGGEVVAVD